MDLEQAAHAAVVMMRQLLEAVAAARSRCEEALANVGALATQLDADRDQLDGALKAMEQQMTDLAGSVSASLTDVEPKVASLAREADAIGQPDPGAAGPTAAQVLDTEAEGLRDMARTLEGIGPELEPLVGAAEAAGQSALARAQDLEEALGTLKEDAEQCVSLRYASFVSSLRDSLEKKGDQVRTVVDGACIALLDDRKRLWDERYTACSDLLDRVFHDIETHTHALVTEALDACAGRVAQTLAELSGAVGLVEAGWLDLETSLASAASCLDTTPPLPERLADVAQAAHDAGEGVVAVRHAWRDQGFGS
jgi:hypothetical protein